VAVLGLSFKPHTDDVRKSRALDVIDQLLERGATVVAYDPVATDNLVRTYPEYADCETLTFVDSLEGALEGADGAVIATDWPEFDGVTDAVDSMAQRVVVDGRRIQLEESALEAYDGLTW